MKTFFDSFLFVKKSSMEVSQVLDLNLIPKKPKAQKAQKTITFQDTETEFSSKPPFRDLPSTSQTKTVRNMKVIWMSFVPFWSLHPKIESPELSNFSDGNDDS